MENAFKTFLFSLCIFSVNPLFPEETKVPSLYDMVETLPFDNHGWFVNEIALTNLLKKHQPRTIIEVGSWLGSSTRFFANKIQKNGLVYAVDHWKGTIDESSQKDQQERVSTLFQRFLSNVKHANLTHKIIPIRMESLEAAKSIQVKANFIYIDAAHDTESVHNDIIAWYPHLIEGGVMAGDDWLAPTVKAGVTSAARILNKSIGYHGQCWWYIDRQDTPTE